MYKNINIASFVTYIPGLIIWIGVLARILLKKAQLNLLVLICCLMMACQIATIILDQMMYTFYLNQYEGNDFNYELYNQTTNAA